MKWLESYGNLITPLVEETHRESEEERGDDSEEEEESGCAPLGTGNLWVTMKLDKKIPQFIPMCGRKIEIYHRGIDITCTNCYKEGHKRQDCQNERVTWLEYVSDFIKMNNISDELYGKWFDLTLPMRTLEVSTRSGNEGDQLQGVDYQGAQRRADKQAGGQQETTQDEENPNRSESLPHTLPAEGQLQAWCVVGGVSQLSGLSGTDYRHSAKYLKNLADFDTGKGRKRTGKMPKDALEENTKSGVDHGEFNAKSGGRPTRQTAGRGGVKPVSRIN